MKKSYLLVGIFIIFVVVISIVGSIIVTGNTKVEENRDIFVMQSNKEAYFNCYGYSIDNPNVIVNPYGNSPLTGIVMFETSDYSDVLVTIKGKDGSGDITYTFPKDKYHLIPIYGLYADYENTVVIKSEDKEKVINIRTDRLPEDFAYVEGMESGNFKFYNGNYPYAIDANNEVRWYLNSNYYGNITILDNSRIVIGSDRYTEDGNTISFYEMSLLGKIYNEYLLEGSYYGINSLYQGNELVLSDRLLLIDLQTGEVIHEYMKNDGYDYVTSLGDDIIVRKDSVYYKIKDDGLDEYSYEYVNNDYAFYDNTYNYKVVTPSRFGGLLETKLSSKKISLIKYDKKDDLDIRLEMDDDRIMVTNNTDSQVYIILDKFLDKRVYDVGYIKYINTNGLHGKYTVYFEINDNIYKTDYYIEV